MKTTFVFLAVLVAVPASAFGQWQYVFGPYGPYYNHLAYQSVYLDRDFYISHFQESKARRVYRYSTQSLLEKAESVNLRERKQAFEGLVNSAKDIKIIDPLGKALSTEPNPELRQGIVTVLGRSGNSKAMDALKKASRDDPNKDVREMAKWAARKVIFTEPMAQLRDKSAYTRAAAIKKVGDLPFSANTDNIVRILSRMLCTDPSPAVRKEAAKVLAKSQFYNPAWALPALKRAKENDPCKEVTALVEEAINSQM